MRRHVVLVTQPLLKLYVSCAVSDYVKSKAEWERVSTRFDSPTGNLERKCSAPLATGTNGSRTNNLNCGGQVELLYWHLFCGFTRCVLSFQNSTTIYFLLYFRGFSIVRFWSCHTPFFVVGERL